MADKITLNPLCGLGQYEPLCYLLQFGGYRILLDCGWDNRFSDNDITNLKKIGHIDCIIISHSTLKHLGALPYLVSKLGLSCPIYATQPTLKMGLMVLYDAFQSIKSQNPNFAHFAIEDVDYAFRLFVPLKFCQSLRLRGNGEGITITPMNAGNVLGGAIWKISRESDDVFYAVDYNHKNERHLNGSPIETIYHPSLLISDCSSFDFKPPPRSQRDGELIKSVMKTLLGEGEVLLPVDAAGRCLELLLVLHSHWKLNNLVGRFSLVFLSHTAKHTTDFANAMVEWASETCQKEFNRTKKSPFNFEFLRICTKLSDLDYIPKPRVILATNPLLENGFSYKVFLELAKNPANLLLLTQRCREDSIAGKLYKNPSADCIQYEITQVEKLVGEELEEHRQFQREAARERRQLEDTGYGMEEEIEVICEDFVFDKKKRKTRRIQKQKMTQIYPMFPFAEKDAKSDEYGEFVDYEKLFVESDDEVDDVVSVEFSKNSRKFIKRDERNKVIRGEDGVKRPKLNHDNSEDDSELDKKNPPVKTVTKISQVDIKCQVKFIDFEGRTDGPSLFNILAGIAPRKLILVHGGAKNASSLKRKLSNICDSISAPKITRVLDVTSQSAFCKLVLDKKLAENLRFSRPLLGHKVASLRAIVAPRSTFSGHPSLALPLQTGGAVAKPSADGEGFFLGNPKLAELRNALAKTGLEANLAKGELLCGQNVSVKKLTPKDFYLNANASEDYFRVRAALYELFETV